MPIFVGADFLGFLILAFPIFQQRYREELKLLVSNTALLSLASSLVIAFLLVLHEFAHILAARRFGNDASAIQLSYFGAVAIPLHGMQCAGEEFQVAFAGPLLNVTLALACTAAQSWAGAMLRSGDSMTRVEVTGLLYAVNHVFRDLNWGLAIFNLLPFFPMDGGRILRSVFWFMTGRKRIATLLACCVTVFGILMFGIFAFRTFRHGSIDAGIRWAAFAILLAVFTTSKVKEELRTEHLEHQPGPVNDA